MPMAEYLRRNNLNLALLMGIRLAKAWHAELNLITVVPTQEDVAGARAHIEDLRDLCRIGDDATTLVIVGEFRDLRATSTAIGYGPHGAPPRARSRLRRRDG